VIQVSTITDSGAPVSKFIFQLKRQDGIVLHGRRWEPESHRALPRYLVITHGACEHGGRYVQLRERAAAAGWTTIAVDLRGHGNSTGDYVHVDRFDEYTDDLRAVCEDQQLPPERTVLLGNSMGGLITLRTVQSFWRDKGINLCSGMILTSPLLAIKHPIESWKKAVSGTLSKYLPRTRFRSTIDNSLLCHDPLILRRKVEDPLIRSTVTARWYCEVDRALQHAFAEADAIRVPTLVLQGGADHVVDPLATRAWVEEVRKRGSLEGVAVNHRLPLVQFRSLPGWYHEVLNEPGADQVRGAILKFAEQAVGTQNRLHSSPLSPINLAGC